MSELLRKILFVCAASRGDSGNLRIATDVCRKLLRTGAGGTDPDVQAVTPPLNLRHRRVSCNDREVE